MYKAPKLVAWIACGALALGLAAPISATATETVVKVPLGDGGFDVAYDGNSFGTVSDSDLSTSGEQNTRVIFTGALDSVADIDDPNASFTLADILLSGAGTMAGSVVVQETTGGNFSLWNSSNQLLLSGSLGNGAITGSENQSTGSYFTTSFSSFTGGSLAALLDPNSAALSLALAGIFTDGSPGLRLVEGVLLPFTADGLVAIEGGPNKDVPEPMTGILVLSGIAVAALARRKKA
jgi:hypothetical protein